MGCNIILKALYHKKASLHNKLKVLFMNTPYMLGNNFTMSNKTLLILSKLYKKFISGNERYNFVIRKLVNILSITDINSINYRYDTALRKADSKCVFRYLLQVLNDKTRYKSNEDIIPYILYSDKDRLIGKGITLGLIRDCQPSSVFELKRTGHISILEAEKQIAGVVKSILN